MTTARWDCSDAGHKGRFTIRRDERDVVSRDGRHCWWPFVLPELGLLGWCETDTRYGDPGNPTMNAQPSTDVYLTELAAPSAAASWRVLANGAGPHPMPTPDGPIVRRVKGPGQIELATISRRGITIDVARTLEYATDPSWLDGVGVTYCAGPPRPGTGAKTPNVEGDGLARVLAPPTLVLYDPVRRDAGDLLVLASTPSAGWAIYRYLIGWPFALPLVAPAPGLVLGPPTTYTAPDGERVLYQCARTVAPLQAWEAWSVGLDGTGHRKEWAAKHPDGKPAAVRFPVIG